MRCSRGILPYAVTLIFVLLVVIPARSQDAGHDVRVRLSLTGGKNIYRTGEPIRLVLSFLVLSFTSEGSGYNLDRFTTKPAHPIDEVLLSPDAGVTSWLDEYSGKERSWPDVLSREKITQTALTVELPLNDWFRFDQPGTYTVRVKTNRVSRPSPPDASGPPIALTTNEVKFRIVRMSRSEEEQEVRRLSALLDATRDWKTEVKVSEDLSYLSGEVSTREKARRFVTSHDRSANSLQNIYFGLFIARDRALVIRLLETALRNPNIAATHDLLRTLTSLRALKEGIEPTKIPVLIVQPGNPEHPRYAEIQNGYVRELVASLPKRSGKSRTTTAMTVLAELSKEPGRAGPVLSDIRKILLEEFDNLHPIDQESLLGVYWEQVRDPAIQPALEGILTRGHEPQGYILRGSALKRLMELDPERAREFVVAELRDPASMVDFDVLQALEDEALPEADAALLEQIRRLCQNGNGIILGHKALLIARYASPAIYSGLIDAYQASCEKWPADARAGLLAYFARYDESQAIPLIEQALSKMAPGQDLSFLVDLTRSNYPDAVGELLHRRLEDEEPQAVGAAAYVMSKHGPARDKDLIEARLDRWVKEWGKDAAGSNEAGTDTNNLQSMVEVNLRLALLEGKSWKLSEEKAAELKQRCVTRACRAHLQVR